MKRIPTATSVVLLSLLASLSWGSSGITYHGRIIKPGGQPLESATTRFRIQIKAPDAGNCVLWEEEQTRNMLGSDGVFTITIGDSTNTAISYSRIDSYGWPMERVFSNRLPFNTLSGCGVGDSYIPNAADGRILEVSFKEVATAPEWEDFPATKINLIPMALNSLQLEGFRASEFLKIDPITNQTPLTNANVNSLLALIAGTSSLYSKSTDALAGDLSGTLGSGTVVGIRGRAVTPDVPAIGQVLKFDGTAWAPAVDESGGSMGDATYLAKGIVRFDTDAATSGISVAAGVARLANTITAAGPVGGASTVPVITYDAKGRLTAVSTAAVNDASKLPLAGGTMTGSINMGLFNITNVTSVAATNFSGRALLLADEDTNNVTIRTPSNIAANYNLTLPANAPTNGYVLSTDATGQLSWIPAASGSVTSVSATAPVLSSGGATPVISLDTGLGAGKIPQVGGTALAANGVIVANALGTALTSLNCMTNQVIKFDASGIATCAADDTGAANAFVNGGNAFGAAATLGTNDGFDLNFETQGSTKMTILANGNVGIGTNAPGARLQVDSAAARSTSGQEVLRLSALNGSAVVGSGPFMSFADVNGNQIGKIHSYWEAPTQVGLALTANGAVNPHLFISGNTGNVGIGTTNPSFALDVVATNASNAGNPIAQFKNSVGVPRLQIVDEDFVDLLPSGIRSDGTSGLGLYSHQGPVIFYANPTATERMRIDTNGNVGIGTTTPSQRLDVAGSIALSGTTRSIVSPASVGVAAPTLSILGSDRSVGFGNGGDIALTGGLGSPDGGSGGSVLLRGGDSLGSEDSAGGVALYGGNGVAGGAVTVRAGDASIFDGGPLYLTAGPSSGDLSSGGPVIIDGGEGQINNVNGGSVIINGGASSGTGLPGNIILGQLYGNVGIGTMSPTTKLQVAGAVRIGNDLSLCNSGRSGAIRYNAGAVQFCNGSAWQSFGVSGAGLTSLNGQSGNTQTLDTSNSGSAPGFISSSNVHTLNIPLASAPGVTSGTISNSDYVNFNSKLTSPLTTKGDVLAFTGSTHLRLPAGTNGQVLSANSATATGLEWVNAGNGDISSVIAGAGLITGGTSGDVTLDVAAGNGIIAAADSVAVDTGLGANKIPQVGGTALNSNGIIVANMTGTALSSLICTVGQVVKFNIMGAAECAADDVGGMTFFANQGNTFGAAATLGTNDAFALNFETQGMTKMTILPSGNVGIGTTNPRATFETVGTSAGGEAGTIMVTNAREDQNSWTGIKFKLADPSGSGNQKGTLAYIANQSWGRGDFHFLQEQGDWAGNATPAHSVMVIKNNGNVGIGTTAPNTALDINGAMSQRGMTAPTLSVAGQGRIYFDSAANKFKVSENGAAYVDLLGGGSGPGDVTGPASATDNAIARFDMTTGKLIQSSDVFIDDSGNVGVGTASPSQKLDVMGIINSNIRLTVGFSGMNNPLFTGSSSGGQVASIWTSSGNGQLRLNDSTVTETVRINASGNSYLNGGNVGIGTTTPDARLTLTSGELSNGTADSAGVTLSNLFPADSSSAQYSPPLVWIGQAANPVSEVSRSVSFRSFVKTINDVTGGYGNLNFQSKLGNGAYSDVLTLTSYGYVGIGTGFPDYPLDVANSVPTGDIMRIRNTSATGYTTINFEDNLGVQKGYVGRGNLSATIHPGAFVFASDGDDMIFDSSITGTLPRMTIKLGGNVGIGTTNPTQKLDVSGTVRAVDFISTSDARAKRNIASLDQDEQLERMCQVNPVAFEWNSNGQPDMGVIAQELRSVYPEFVVENSDGTLSVKYNSLIAPLISSVQSLRRQLQDEQNKNLILEKKVLDLEARQKALEEKFNRLAEKLEK